MKRKFIIPIFIFLAVVLAASVTIINLGQRSAERVVREFLNSYYTVTINEIIDNQDDLNDTLQRIYTEEFSTTITNDVFQSLAANRRIPEITLSGSSYTITPEKIKINNTGDYIFKYTISINLNDGNKIKSISNNGIISAQKHNNTWIVTNFTPNYKDFVDVIFK